MTRLLGQGLLATACSLCLLSASGEARAQPGPDAERTSRPDEYEMRQEHVQHEPQKRLALGTDLVVGFGQYPLLLPTRGSVPAGWASVGPQAVGNASLLVAGSYEIVKHLTLGLRVPLSLGGVPQADTSTRSAFAFGNLELEAESELELSETVTLAYSLGLALPTAQGSEDPVIEEGGPTRGYDRFVVNRVAASSRGFEDNALFEVDRFGIVPKLVIRVHADHVLFAPFVKLENLFGTRSGLERKYIGELVLGTFLGYELSEHLDIGTRLWSTVAFLDKVEAVGVVEPQLRGHFAPVDIVVGGIIPFAGALTEPQFGGVRLAVAARL